MATVRPAPRPDAGRLASLDVLRGVAILLVLAQHPIVAPQQAGYLRPLAALMLRVGWTGVDLFFVLSGFLIGGLLCAEIRERGALDVPRFLVRRAFKIWPSYLLFIAFVFVRIVAADPRHAAGSALAAVLPNLLHVQNYLGTVRVQTWSLAVEEHFYLVLPFALRLIARRDGARLALLPPLALTVMVATLAARVLEAALHPLRGIPYATHLRLDGLFFGVLLGYLYHYRPERFVALGRHRAALFGLGLALVAPMSVLDPAAGPWVATLGLTALYLGYGAILVAAVCARNEAPPGRVGAALAGVGRASYSMYLWFLDVAFFLFMLGLGGRPLDHLFPPGKAIDTAWWCIAEAAYVAAVTAVGVGMSRLVERPALALRDRLFPARAVVAPPLGVESAPRVAMATAVPSLD